VASQGREKRGPGGMNMLFWGLTKLLLRELWTLFNLCVSKTGIAQAKKILAIAHGWNLLVSPQCFHVSPSLLATLHLTISDQECLFMETPIVPLEVELFTEPIKPMNGYWKVPNRPGWGVDVDTKILSKNPYKW